MNQVAEVSFRGKQYENIKNLTEDQKKEVQKLLTIAMDDPAIRDKAFSIARRLRGTIGDEYAILEYGFQEALLGAWKCAASALYYKPEPAVVNTRKDRIKYFKTYMWHFCDQLIKENPPPRTKETKTLFGTPAEIAAELIEEQLKQIDFKGISLEFTKIDNEGGTCFILNTFEIPLRHLKKLHQIARRYVKHDVATEFEDEHISISGGGDKSIKVKVLFHRVTPSLSFDAQKDDSEGSGSQYQIEAAALPRTGVASNLCHQVEMKDTVDALYKKLRNKTARKVLTILLDPPQKFVDKYGSKFPRKTAHIAKFLGIKPSTVSRFIWEIQMTYCTLGELA